MKIAYSKFLIEIINNKKLDNINKTITIKQIKQIDNKYKLAVLMVFINTHTYIYFELCRISG